MYKYEQYHNFPTHEIQIAKHMYVCTTHCAHMSWELQTWLRPWQKCSKKSEDAHNQKVKQVLKRLVMKVNTLVGNQNGVIQLHLISLCLIPFCLTKCACVILSKIDFSLIVQCSRNNLATWFRVGVWLYTGKAHPNIYKAVNLFEAEQAATEITLIQLAAGDLPVRRRRKNRIQETNNN